jgi:hypothetical protein
VAEAEEKIVKIFRSAGATDDEIQLIRRGLQLWREGKMNGNELYYYLTGIARELLIPLTPRQIGDLREALGLPRSMS